MPTVKSIEKKIWDIEQFAVTIMRNGKDVRSDCGRLPQYPAYERMAKNDWTVAQWKEGRFSQVYPGFHAEILDGDGNICAGNMKLGTVRDSYFDE